jgi:hypothetical protein
VSGARAVGHRPALLLQTGGGGRVGVADVVERCVSSGANQLLFVFDTVFKGSVVCP